MKKITIHDLRKFFRTIKFSIVFSNLAILFSSVLWVVFYTHQETNDVLIQSSQTSARMNNENIQKIIREIFSRIEKITKNGSVVFSNYESSSNFSDTAIKVMISLLESNEYITSSFFGKTDGFFFSISEKSEKDNYRGSQEKKLPQGTKYGSKIIYTTKSEREEKWTYIDPGLTQLAEETIKDAKYDPRQRPWYQQTKNETAVNWTDVYYFTGSIKEPGITASFVMIDDKKKQTGVFAVDVGLSNLHKILERTKATRNSNSYIVDSSGRIICTTETLQKKYDEQNNVIFSSITDQEASHVKQFIDCAETKSENILYSTYKNKLFMPIVEEMVMGNIKWKIVSAISVDDLIEPFNRKTKNILLVSILILIISAFAMFLFARKISISITQLAGSAKKIENFQPDERRMIKSNILEIQDLSRSMDAMQRSMDSFSKYVPKDLVMKLIRDESLSEISGDMKEITLMFTDIANFTSISESMKANDLIKQMSDYFGCITEIIINNKGNVDKYIGDAIMSFWGAPDLNPNHPTNACHAALQTQRLLRTKNSDWINLGQPAFITRIGIHTGTVIVGNIGSELRMNYTAIGDDVNLAARLEGLNKFYQTEILISGDTYAKVAGDFLARPLGKVAVKGKDTFTAIYELIGALRHVDPKLLLSPHKIKEYEKYCVAYDYFEQKRFSNALEIFMDIEAKDGPVSMMIEECQKLCDSPPDETWKGLVRNLHEK